MDKVDLSQLDAQELRKLLAEKEKQEYSITIKVKDINKLLTEFKEDIYSCVNDFMEKVRNYGNIHSNSKDLITQNNIMSVMKVYSPQFIIDYVENKTGIHITSKSRVRRVVDARRVAMFIMTQKTDLSTKEVGSLLGGKDSSTVSEASRVVTEKLKNDKVFRNKYAHILKFFGLNN